MNILYFQCLSGISGDMSVGALLDLGIDQTLFLTELKKLNLEGYQISIERKQKNGITGTKFTVLLDGQTRPDVHAKNASAAQPDHSLDHHHEHLHNQASGHSSDHSHSHVHNHDHGTNVHRNLLAVEKLIDNSDLSLRVKELSKNMFRHVAAAEAKVHDKPLTDVHFHEVGAVDSIVDIVGVAIAIELLDINEIYASPLHVGNGFVKCQHGRIPVPSPATVEILRGIPIYSKGIESELVTPTGAAIIKTLAKEFMPLPAMVVDEIGYGLGPRICRWPIFCGFSKGKKKP